MTDDDLSRQKTLTSSPQSPLPARIGDYRIVRKLGEGGMGVVYEAEQQHPKRPVALKVIRGGRYVDEHHVRLFEREAQTLARLKHPGIAAIYESGRTEEGQHFFAMELVRGETLAQHLGRRVEPAHAVGEELRYRLRLMQHLCEAVAYAHQRGVIHRDLKPANVLVARESAPASGSQSQAAAEIKILDFGLARITDVDVAVSTILTDVGAVQGTIPYMSSEQIRGNPDEIDLRTDVYSLGVLMYEMLTGRLPLEVKRLPLPEAARVICEKAPEAISKDWSGAQKLDADVATIVLKALEKEPSRRYQSASALSEDIERYLTDQPILARPPSAAYQLRKLMSRHRAAFVAGMSALAMLIGFAVTMTVQAERIARARDRANEEAETAKQVSEFLVGLFEVSDPFEARGNTITAREILDKGAEKIERELKGQPLVQARMMDTMGKVYTSLGLHDTAEPLLRKALSIREEGLGPTHPDVAETLTSLGRSLQVKGELEEAIRVLRTALDIRDKVLAPGTVDAGWSRYFLGSTLAVAGHYQEARPLLEQARKIFATALGPDHWAVAWCLNDLGRSYENMGDYAAARPFYAEALRIKEKLYGRDHPDVGIGLNNVGFVLAHLGDYQSAEPLIERALRINEINFGSDHPATADSFHSLGDLLRLQGRFMEARPALERALSIQSKTLDSDAPPLALTLDSLARVLQALGETGHAEEHFRRALAIREKAFPPGDPSIADTLEGYASLLRATGRAAQAALLEDRARAIRAKHPSPGRGLVSP